MEANEIKTYTELDLIDITNFTATDIEALFAQHAPAAEVPAADVESNWLTELFASADNVESLFPARKPVKACPRCKGSGNYTWTRNFQNHTGQCFRCAGTGEWQPGLTHEQLSEVRRFHGNVEAALLARNDAYND